MEDHTLVIHLVLTRKSLGPMHTSRRWPSAFAMKKYLGNTNNFASQITFFSPGLTRIDTHSAAKTGSSRTGNVENSNAGKLT